MRCQVKIQDPDQLGELYIRCGRPVTHDGLTCAYHRRLKHVALKKKLKLEEQLVQLAERRRVSAFASWRNKAECRQGNGLDDVDFSPETARAQALVAEICHHLCPVRAECLRDALENDERFGVLGGMTSRQRAQMQLPRRESK